jgi:predicted DsbA family dithiol-disulfide isomerase
MRVEIVLDIACVWSYLGYTRFTRAAEQYRAEGGEVDVAFRPFQVDPSASAHGQPLLDVLRSQLGADVEGKTSYFALLAARDGLEMNFNRAVHPNTLEAHRLIAQAESQGLGDQMVERLFRACHTDGLNIGDIDTLAELATEIGVTDSGSGADQLRAELDLVRSLGISGVPVFRFPDGLSLTGAQSQEALLDALHDAHVHSHP